MQKSDLDADARFLSKISNLDPVGGRYIHQGSAKAIYNAGNQLWHSDRC